MTQKREASFRLDWYLCYPPGKDLAAGPAPYSPSPKGVPECPPIPRPHGRSVHITHSSSKMSPLAGTQEHRVTHEPPQPAGLCPVVGIGDHRHRRKLRSWRLDQRHGGLGWGSHRHPGQTPTSDLYPGCAKKNRASVKNKWILSFPCPIFFSLRNAWLVFQESKGLRPDHTNSYHFLGKPENNTW